jgi:hypothetical protein
MGFLQTRQPGTSTSPERTRRGVARVIASPKRLPDLHVAHEQIPFLRRPCDGHGLARLWCGVHCPTLWRPVLPAARPLSVFRQYRRLDDSSKCVVRPRKAATEHGRPHQIPQQRQGSVLGLKPSANLHRLYLISPTRSNCYPGRGRSSI